MMEVKDFVLAIFVFQHSHKLDCGGQDKQGDRTDFLLCECNKADRNSRNDDAYHWHKGTEEYQHRQESQTRNLQDKKTQCC